jgi:hypothetical protein
MTLADDAAVLVHERDRAADVVAEDGEERTYAPAFEHRFGQTLVHREGTFDSRQLLVREPRRDRLRQGDERHLVRHRQDRKAESLGFLDERCGRLGPPEADAEREPGEAVLGQPSRVLALRAGEIAETQSRGDQQLAAFEPRGRVGQLGDVHPADRIVEPGATGREAELEAG